MEIFKSKRDFIDLKSGKKIEYYIIVCPIKINGMDYNIYLSCKDKLQKSLLITELKEI